MADLKGLEGIVFLTSDPGKFAAFQPLVVPLLPFLFRSPSNPCDAITFWNTHL